MATEAAKQLGSGLHVDVQRAMREEAEIRDAVNDDEFQKSKHDPKLTALLNNPQLNRKRLTERVNLEKTLVDNGSRFCIFMLALTLFLLTVTAYDPTGTINSLHRSFRQRFNFFHGRGPHTCNTPTDVMEYVQFFLKQSYEMSSALIDANTFTDIDVRRCFSPSVTDVCRLDYWTIPLNKQADNYLNPTQLYADQLAPDNFAPSVMDCSQPIEERRENCINRSSPAHQVNSSKRTFGLTPEDPIILDSKSDYPLGSVLPLAPIVWQTRGRIVNCSGFGDKYNTEVLGAGLCTPDKSCSPDQVTEFYSSQPNLNSKRQQSLFVTYVEDAFRCQNNWDEPAEFFDKSWSPWAGREQLTNGIKAPKGTINGENVWYKFISDVAYLEAPTSTYVRSDPSLIQDWSANDQVLCNPSKDANCVNPLDESDHDMWTEINTRPFENSYHDHFSRKFLSATRARTDYQNTFFTYETSTFVIAAVIITPFSENFPDIATLVMVEFSVSQAGLITASTEVVSTSETLEAWYRMAEITVFVFLSYIVVAARRLRTHRFTSFEGKMSVFDITLALCSIGSITATYLIDRFPPDVTETLINALKQNTQEAYFNSYATIIDYQQSSKTSRTCAFAIALILFVRLNLYLAVHPRLAVLARTLHESSVDIIHFMIYLVMILAFLLLIGWWSFGPNQPAYSTMPIAIYRLFRMFTGDSLFDFVGFDPDQPPDFKLMIYLIIFVFLIFFILLNFFLAIIVNAYTEVQERGHHVELTDNTCFWDVLDAPRPLFHWLRGNWPNMYRLSIYFQHEGQGTEEHSAVTAEELFAHVFHKSGTPAFKNLKAAEDFVGVYMNKVVSGDERMLKEYRLRCLFPKGEHWSPKGEHRQHRPAVNVLPPSHDEILLKTVDTISTSLQKVHEDLREMREQEQTEKDGSQNQDESVPSEIAVTVGKPPVFIPSTVSPRGGKSTVSPRSANPEKDKTNKSLVSTAIVDGNRSLQDIRKQNADLESELIETRAQNATMKMFADNAAYDAVAKAMAQQQIKDLQEKLSEMNSELSVARAKLRNMDKQRSQEGSTNPIQLAVQPVETVHDETVEKELKDQIRSAELKVHAATMEVDMIKLQKKKVDLRLELLEQQKEIADTSLNEIKVKLATSRIQEERLKAKIYSITGLPTPDHNGFNSMSLETERSLTSQTHV